MAQMTHRSFTGGELAPSLRSRADLSKYATGLALCENFIIRSQGGVYSRQGTKFIGEVGQPTKRARLIPFSFSTEQTYILVFEEYTMRVIKDGGFVLDGAGPALYELATPYPEADLPRLSFTQDADVMTICHPDYDPRDLSRTAHDAWSLDVINFDPPISAPTWYAPSASITNITNDTNALVTTAAAHGMASGDRVYVAGVSGMTEVNGLYFYITYAGPSSFYLNVDSSTYGVYTSGGTATAQSLIPTGSGAGSYSKIYTYVITAVGPDGESLGSSSKSITVGSLSTTYGIRLKWNSVPNALYYRVYKDPSNATNVYGWVGDSNTLEFTDFNTAPIVTDAPPTDNTPFKTISASITNITQANPAVVTAVAHGFSTGNNISIASVVGMTEVNNLTFVITVIDEDSFSLNGIDSSAYTAYTSGGTATRVNNKPSVVGYYQQRRIFANTTELPQTMYGTQVSAYESLRYSVPSRDDDAITLTIKSRQVNEIRHITDVDGLVLLTSGAEWKITEGQDEVLTPATAGAKTQSYNGSSWVQPVIVGDTLIYIQDKGNRIRDLKYEFTANKYTGSDLSIMAEHLFENNTIEEVSYSKEPYGLIWMVRDDGKMLGLTYQREHQVWAWHQHDFGGIVESVATVSEGSRDATYICIKRTINGSTVRYVERMEPRDITGPEYAWCVDSGLRYEGVATTSITGADHLIGEQVAVVADGNEVKGLTVDATGGITLPISASIVTLGKAFTPTMELLDVDISDPNNTLKGKKVSIARVIIEVEKSRGGWVGPKLDDGSTGDMIEIKPRFESDGYGPIALKDFKQEIHIAPEWGYGGGIRIEQRTPFPLAILSVIPDVDVG